jgi:choline dehydrogenase
MLDYIHRASATMYYPCGTNRMDRDKCSGVDPELRVRDVDGLRVVDASAFPLVPSSNIHPAC